MVKLAVVTTYYNEIDLIKSVVDVIAKIEVPFTFFLVDDCSSKKPTPVLEAYGDKPWFQYIRNSENLGAARSLNKGVAAALESGAQFIAINDADDISYPNRFRDQVAALEKDADLMVIGGAADMVDQESGTLLWRCFHPHSPETINRENKINATFVHSTVIYRAEVFQKIGYYREDSYAFDYELISRALNMGLKAANLRKLVLRYNIRGGSLSMAKRRTQVLSRLRTQIRYFSPFYWQAYWGVLRSLLVIALPGDIVNRIKSSFYRCKTPTASETV